MPWAFIITELVKFIATLILGGGGVLVVSAMSGSDLQNQVASSDGAFSGVIWMCIGAGAVYLWMSGIGVGGVLKFVLGLVKRGLNSIVTIYKDA